MQAHGDRLSAVDAAFLELETPQQHMHVGGLFLFEPRGEPFDFERFVRLIRSRLHLVPRYRQRLAFTPWNVANPIWVDDADFDITYHVRHAALPRPGTREQLTEFAGRVWSRPLNRGRPLWEVYVIEGCEEGGVALLSKNHHAMIDGISGMDIAQMIFDLAPDTHDEVPPPEPWAPQPTPDGYSRVVSGLKEALGSPVAHTVDRVRRASAAPTATLRKAARIGQGVLGVASSNMSRAPRTALSRPLSVNRRFAYERIPLAEVKAVKNVLGGTVNDVVLAMCGDAIGRFLRDRGDSTAGLALRAMVPVSVRSEEQRDQLGNQVTSVFVDLPVDAMDPIERLRRCSSNMGDVKESHQAVGADFLVGLTEFAPPAIHARASRLAASSRLFNLTITNVPGPQVPLYVMGFKMHGMFPFIPLVRSKALAIGVTSIDGVMAFGFTADYDALPDVDRLPVLLRAALDDLQASAEAVRDRKDRAAAPTVVLPEARPAPAVKAIEG